MTLDLNKPIKTRDGRDVRIICTDRKSKYFTIVALITNQYKEDYFSYTKDGEFYYGEENSRDLVNVKEKKTGWVNIYKLDNKQCLIGTIYKTKDEAKFHEDDRIIDTVKIEWEE